MPTSTDVVLTEVELERARQDKLFPDQHLPNGTSRFMYASRAAVLKARNNRRLGQGTLTWLDVLYEEVYEAFAETDPAKLRDELVQVAAVAVRWVEDIDRERRGGEGS